MVSCAPPMTAVPAGPERSRPSLMARAAALRASDQRTSARVPSTPLAIGAARRASLPSASKPKRPLSHSQLQFTGSESTPAKRSTSLREASTTIRQPTEQLVQVDSTTSRSHGRALKR